MRKSCLRRSVNDIQLQLPVKKESLCFQTTLFSTLKKNWIVDTSKPTKIYFNIDYFCLYI